MEKFMLIFSNTPTNQQPSPEAMQAIMGKWMGWVDKLKKEGRYLSGEPLLPSGKVVKGHDKKVTDGPYTEGKEIIGGFFIVSASDINDAIALCNDYPDFDKGGSVHVRQIQKM